MPVQRKSSKIGVNARNLQFLERFFTFLTGMCWRNLMNNGTLCLFNMRSWKINGCSLKKNDSLILIWLRMESTAKKIRPVISPKFHVFAKQRAGYWSWTPVIHFQCYLQFRVQVWTADISPWRSKCPKTTKKSQNQRKQRTDLVFGRFQS